MKTLKIEAGKYYRTRNGRKARIYATDGAGAYLIHGAICLGNEAWGIDSWTSNGHRMEKEESPSDIISEWKQTIDDIGFDKSCLPKWAKFICMNKSGCWYWFEMKPVYSIGDLGYWDVSDESPFGIIPAEHAPKNYQGNWKDSLFEIK